MFDKSLFTTIAMGMFRAAHPNLQASHDELFESVIQQFGADELTSDAVTEANRFNDWIKKWKYDVQLGSIDRITVTLQVPMGQGYANIGLQANFPITFAEGDGLIETTATQATINATARDLMSKVFLAYTSLKSFDGFAVKDNGALSPANTNAPPANNAERHTSESIVCNIQEGKRQYRIRGGWFKQYGAAVYEEVLVASGIDPQTIATTPTPFVRQIDVVKNEKNQPKVVKIY